LLGRGGFGCVYLAKNKKLFPLEIAIKVSLLDYKKMVNKFLKIILILSKIIF